jgi:hypothetical protein
MRFHLFFKAVSFQVRKKLWKKRTRGARVQTRKRQKNAGWEPSLFHQNARTVLDFSA